MPELPEVETIVSHLRKSIKNFIIVDFWSDWPKSLKDISLPSFRRKIKNKKIIDCQRYGKNIFLNLDSQESIYIHLKMTGHLLVKKIGEDSPYFQEKVNQYIHHRWFLQSPACPTKQKYDFSLDFSDLRKFGKIKLVKQNEVKNLPEIKKLGPDALDLTFTAFCQKIKKNPRKKIGLFLLDQNIIAGVGNIYRSEILFASQISPFRACQNLSLAEQKKIFLNLKKILHRAIKKGGTSASDFRDIQGAPGNFQNFLQVYRRAGKKCSRCNNIIQEKKLNGRSVYYCPNCQK